MKVTAIPVRDEDHWHELRLQHVGGSEVAAALGVSQWKSKYGLWAEKSGKVSPPNLDHLDHVLFGKLLETPIAQAVAQRTGWAIKETNDYLSALPGLPLGGTIDRLIDHPTRGKGILEAKTTSYSQYADWTNSGEPPLSYLLQVTAYMALAEVDWGVIAVLVSGQRLEIHEVERRDSVVDMIKDGIAEFWRHVSDNEAPPVDYERDSAVVAELYRSVTSGKVLDLTDNARATQLCWSYLAAHAAEKQATGLKDAARAELTELLGDAERAQVKGYRVNSTLIPATPERIADPGEKISGRRGYRRVMVTEKIG